MKYDPSFDRGMLWII